MGYWSIIGCFIVPTVSIVYSISTSVVQQTCPFPSNSLFPQVSSFLRKRIFDENVRIELTNSVTFRITLRAGDQILKVQSLSGPNSGAMTLYVCNAKYQYKRYKRDEDAQYTPAVLSKCRDRLTPVTTALGVNQELKFLIRRISASPWPFWQDKGF